MTSTGGPSPAVPSPSSRMNTRRTRLSSGATSPSASQSGAISPLTGTGLPGGNFGTALFIGAPGVKSTLDLEDVGLGLGSLSLSVEATAPPQPALPPRSYRGVSSPELSATSQLEFRSQFFYRRLIPARFLGMPLGIVPDSLGESTDIGVLVALSVPSRPSDDSAAQIADAITGNSPSDSIPGQRQGPLDGEPHFPRTLELRRRSFYQGLASIE